MIKKNSLPRHIAIIMDGNGRWAKKQKLPRTRGHLEGTKRVEEIIAAASKAGIEVLTLYAFSTENWRRPKSEVSMLMRTLVSVLKRKLRLLIKEGIRIRFIGDRQKVGKTVLAAIEQAESLTKGNRGLVLNIAFNYGSRFEIIDAVKKIAGDVKNGKINVAQIDERIFSRMLYTAGLPDPDLLIRTSGEKRISNFLLWQLSYSELYFTDVLWPDFNAKEFHCALSDYAKRERRYGDVKTPKEHNVI